MTAYPRPPLGKLPARPGAVTFAAANYLIPTQLPKPPKEMGYEHINREWEMFGNDRLGDCVFAGAGHEHMVWANSQNQVADFDDQGIIGAYSEVTGYIPGDPSTDQGTDMAIAAAWRRKVGLADAQGVRHPVLAYLSIKPKSIQALYQALYLFGSVGIGIEFPETAYKQIHEHKPWSYKPGANIVGRHYIPAVAKRKHIEIVTWGQLQSMTTCFYRRYNDETIVYLSPESLDRLTGLSPLGFNVTQLLADLAALG